MTIAKKALTDPRLKAIAKGGRNWIDPDTGSPVGRRIIWDSNLQGFGARPRKDGRVSLVIEKRINGSRSAPVRTVGIWPDESYGDILERAKEWMKEVRAYKPLPTRMQRKAAALKEARAAEYAKIQGEKTTLRGWLPLYMKSIAKLRTKDNYAYRLQRYLYQRPVDPVDASKGKWEAQQAAALDDNLELGRSILLELEDADKVPMLLNVQTTLRNFQQFLLKQGPNRGGISKPFVPEIKFKADEKPARVLSNDELRVLWQVCEEPWFTITGTRAGMPDYFNKAIQFVLASAQREWMVIGARRRERDNNKLWTIPAERCKNQPQQQGREHGLPLNDTANRIWESLPTDDYVFGVKLTKNQSRTWWNDRQQKLHRKMKAVMAGLNIPFKHFTIHELRHTAGTRMEHVELHPAGKMEDGTYVPARTVGAATVATVMHHSKGGKDVPRVTSRYLHHVNVIAMKDALDAWDRELQKIVSTAPRKRRPLPPTMEAWNRRSKPKEVI
jgi:integrase